MRNVLDVRVRCGVRKALGVWTMFAYRSNEDILIALPFPSWRSAFHFAFTGTYVCEGREDA